MTNENPSTGFAGLDEVLAGLLPGDNVVWQVEAVDDYLTFCDAYRRRSLDAGKEVVYFRFARHAPLCAPGDVTRVVELDPGAGFESFIAGVHAVLRGAGPHTACIFDVLSDLAADWYSDQMLGNFFMLTCPYVLDIRALAYFGVMRNSHSTHALVPIADTTQILLDVFRHHGRLCIRPLKVEWRYSPTMYTLHTLEEGRFHPVTESALIAEVMTSIPRLQLESASQRLDVWSRTLSTAERAAHEEAHARVQPGGAARHEGLFNQLLRMMISRDERVLQLARRWLTLPDLVAISRRMLGSGLIGGKSVGMLLARAILQRTDPRRWERTLEVHDSFTIGSDVFYTFLVRNRCWWLRERQRDPETMLDGAEEARARILAGDFPPYIMHSFADMLDYFGQSPIIVRSSSLLEDNFGNAFSGKYDSVFCPNQGTRSERMAAFVDAVRSIYASTMSEEALRYRAQRGILERDEQMALLVQRVSGGLHGGLFYPHVAGVGYSHNPYVWSPDIDPDAGMLRIVFGLGTRAVDRTDDDYARIVALNAPEKRPEADAGAVRRYAQRRVDCINLAEHRFDTVTFEEAATAAPDLPLDMVAQRDPDLERMAAERGTRVFTWVPTFQGLLRNTTLVADMRGILSTLQAAYGAPVDIEFTANLCDGALRINVVQCRPLPAGEPRAETPVEEVADPVPILRTSGPVIGTSRTLAVDRVILVVPEVYGALPLSQRYSVARLIGRLTRLEPGLSTLLVGPGRWGTATPELGVPVTFAEIAHVRALCEVAMMREGLVPDVSLGTHFFNDVVEMGMLYLAVFPGRGGEVYDPAPLLAAPNRLPHLLPSDAARADAVRVVDAADIAPGAALHLRANALAQTAELAWGRVPPG